MHADQDGALSRIVDRFGELGGQFDAVVVVGSDYTDVTTGNEWASNAQIAANLGSPVVLVVHGRGRTRRRIAATVELARSELVGLARASGRGDREPGRPGAIVQEVRALLARTGLAVGGDPGDPGAGRTDGRGPAARRAAPNCVRGDPELLGKESMGFVVAAMSLPNVLTRLREGYTVIAPGDRYDVLPALIAGASVGDLPEPGIDRADRRIRAGQVGAAADRRGAGRTCRSW